jgi:hypothetical protein
VLEGWAFGLVPRESLEVKTRLIFNLHSSKKRCNLHRMLKTTFADNCAHFSAHCPEGNDEVQTTKSSVVSAGGREVPETYSVFQFARLCTQTQPFDRCFEGSLRDAKCWSCTSLDFKNEFTIGGTRDSSVGIAARYRDGRSRVRNPVGPKFSLPVQTDHEAHAAPCTISTMSFPGVK